MAVDHDTEIHEVPRDIARVMDVVTKVGARVEEVMTSEGYLAWLASVSKFHSYSPYNQLLIWLQRPDATRVAGYRKWQELGRQVQKGSKGIRILRPFPEEDPETGRTIVRKFGTVSVFDVSDTEGDPLPEYPPMPPIDEPAAEQIVRLLAAYVEQLDATVHLTGAPNDLMPEARGWCVASKRQIYVRFGPDISAGSMLRTLIHELGHLEDPQILTDQDRDTKEFVAESVAVVVADAIGLDISETGAWYLASWGGTPERLLPLVKRIGRASSRIVPLAMAAAADARAEVTDAA